MVIRVRMTNDRVLDVGRIQPELLESANDFLFHGIVKDRVDQNDALRGRDGPDGILGLTDEVEVIEHLDRFCVPCGSIRRRTLSATATASALTARRSCSSALTARCACGGATTSATCSTCSPRAAPLTGGSTHEVEQVLIVLSRCGLRDGHVRFGGVSGVLRRLSSSKNGSGQKQPNADLQFHNGGLLRKAALWQIPLISVYFPAMRYRLLAVFAVAAAIVLTITFGHAQQRAPQPAPAAPAAPQRGQQAAPAAQRGQQGYQMDRPARLYNRPNLNGIWQAMNSANWNLEAHNAEAFNDFWRLGAIGAIPAGRSVVREGTIP